MAVLLEEVVLRLPNHVESQPVGKLDLLQRLVEDPVLGVGVPRLGNLVFVEQTELQAGISPELICDDVNYRRPPSTAQRVAQHWNVPAASCSVRKAGPG